MNKKVASRYSKALFELDASNGHQKSRLRDFETILKLFKDYPKLEKLLCTPIITQEEKEGILKGSLKAIQDPIFLNFLFYVMKKKRLEHLKEIAAGYQDLLDNLEGVTQAELLTAIPITNILKEKIINKLENFYKKKLILKEVIDPTMKGPIVLMVGNHIIDWSLQTRLKKLKDKLLGMDI